MGHKASLSFSQISAGSSWPPRQAKLGNNPTRAPAMWFVASRTADHAKLIYLCLPAQAAGSVWASDAGSRRDRATDGGRVSDSDHLATHRPKSRNLGRRLPGSS